MYILSKNLALFLLVFCSTFAWAEWQYFSSHDDFENKTNHALGNSGDSGDIIVSCQAGQLVLGITGLESNLRYLMSPPDQTIRMKFGSESPQDWTFVWKGESHMIASDPESLFKSWRDNFHATARIRFVNPINGRRTDMEFDGSNFLESINQYPSNAKCCEG